MNIFFAAGDVGGARAILPVARLAHATSHNVMCLAHGPLQQEGSADWQWFDSESAQTQCKQSDVLIYATSVNDNAAITLARAAQSVGIPCVHVLDNWSSYYERIETLAPQAYAVMDDLAFTEAANAGVPRHILHITGHPDIAKLAHERDSLPGPSREKTLLFISEPVAQDGRSVKEGYDEALVTQGFFRAISKIATNDLILKIAPHPREDRKAVERRISSLCVELDITLRWSMVGPKDVRKTLHSSSHCVGMTSILLYESWLLGRPTLSLQPENEQPISSSFTQRTGLMVHDSKHSFFPSVFNWLQQNPQESKQDLHQHASAAKSIINLAVNIAQVSSNDSLVSSHQRHATNNW